MPFNPQTTLTQIEQEFLNLGLSQVPILLSITNIYLTNASDALTKLDLSYQEDHDDEFLNSRIAEEKDLFTSQYLGLAIVSEQIASDVRDKTIAIVAQTVLDIIAGLITKA